MGASEWVIAASIKSITEAMCLSLAKVGQEIKRGEIEASSQLEMMAWAFSLGRPQWTECGENAFCYSSGEKVQIEPNDDIKTLALKIVLAEQGETELAANGFTKEKIAKIIDDEVKDYMRH